MPLRALSWDDLEPASRVLANAFSNEDLIADHMHPYKDRYPDDFHLYFLRSLRLAYVDRPDSHLVVAYRDDEHSNNSNILGVAHWQRKRTRPSMQPFKVLQHKVVAVYNYIESVFYPNRALDPNRANVIEANEPFIAHFWTGTRAESWYLNLLGVEPKEEGRGIGRELVRYGFNLAKAEGVGCSVIASDGKDGFYQRVGFDVIVGTTSAPGGDQNPMSGIPGGSIHFWDNDLHKDSLLR